MKKMKLIAVIMTIAMAIAGCGDTEAETEAATAPTEEVEEEISSEEATELPEASVEEDLTEEVSAEVTEENSEPTNPDIDTRRVLANMMNNSTIRTRLANDAIPINESEVEIFAPSADKNFNSLRVFTSDLLGNGSYKIKSIEGHGNGFWLVTENSDTIDPSTVDDIYIIGNGTPDEELNSSMKASEEGIEVDLTSDMVVVVYNVGNGSTDSVYVNFEAMSVTPVKDNTNEDPKTKGHIKLSDGSLHDASESIKLSDIENAEYILDGDDVEEGVEYVCSWVLRGGSYFAADSTELVTFPSERYKKDSGMSLTDAYNYFDRFSNNTIYIKYMPADDYEKGDYSSLSEVNFNITINN